MTATNKRQSLQGLVLKKNNGLAQVLAEETLYTCTLSPLLARPSGSQSAGTGRKSLTKKTGKMNPVDPVVVGDQVFLVPQDRHQGVIVEVLPRHNQFSRRSVLPMPGAHPHEQVIAANIDQVVPVFSIAQPEPHWNMLDRYLVSAALRDLPALICITKMDLGIDPSGVESQSLAEDLEVYTRIGYPLVTVSARTGQGLKDLQSLLEGKISLLVGKSGVGKSSLLNAILPGFALRVNSVNPVTGKGRHTTTGQEMYLLEGGGAIVDTPGEREFGLWGAEDVDPAQGFPEMRPFLGHCRYGLGCHHDEEPGCAVRKAVMSGLIHPRRYHSLLRLKEELRV